MKVLVFFVCFLAATVVAEGDICQLKPYAGEVEWNESMKRDWRYSYSYDRPSNRCYAFIYGGTGGNANSFESVRACEKKCKRNPCAEEPFVNTNEDTVLSYCGKDRPMWSYIADSNECQEYTYNGCGHNLNNFPYKENCEAACKKH